MKRVDCGEMGFFEYKEPNVPEGMKLTAVVFPSDVELVECSSVPNLLVAKCTEHMGFLVKNVELKVNDKVITVYDDMMEEYDLIPYIVEMAADILGYLELAIKKKNG